jgi:hypothetical protein
VDFALDALALKTQFVDLGEAGRITAEIERCPNERSLNNTRIGIFDRHVASRFSFHGAHECFAF